MKHLIYSYYSKNYEDLAELTFPRFEKYAKEIGAEFKYYEEPICFTRSEAHGYYEADKNMTDNKFKCFEYLNEYDKVMWVDCDVFVNNFNENIFDEISNDHFSICIDYIATDDYKKRMDMMFKGQAKLLNDNSLLNLKWNDMYYNTGVFVANKIHKDIFLNEPRSYSICDGDFINYIIIKNNLPVQCLNFKWNYASFMFHQQVEDILKRKEGDSVNFLHFTGWNKNQSKQIILELLRRR